MPVKMTKFGLNKERKVFLSSKEKGCEIIYTFFSGSIFLWQLTEIALGLFIFFIQFMKKKIEIYEIYSGMKKTL